MATYTSTEMIKRYYSITAYQKADTNPPDTGDI